MSYIYASSNAQGDPPPPGAAGDPEVPGAASGADIKPPMGSESDESESDDADIKPPTVS